ncbi:MAG: hypothetical protein QOH89_1153, partial [Pseudonocardiales bacterium]|nr:hypothetical protein [Pseudonocardiales bacterium]
AEPGEPAAAEPAPVDPAAPRVGKGNQSTAADLELLRQHSDVRARVLAAVLAPFVVYTLVMFLFDALDVYFIWVWLPLVSAGVLAGSILDAAHRRRGRDARPTDQGTSSPSSSAP